MPRFPSPSAVQGPVEGVIVVIELTVIAVLVAIIHANPSILPPMEAHSPTEPVRCAANMHMEGLASGRFGYMGKHCVDDK